MPLVDGVKCYFLEKSDIQDISNEKVAVRIILKQTDAATLNQTHKK